MIAFWILAPIMVVAALGILFARKAVHAAMLLAVVMMSLAVLYVVQDAPFLFAVQIIVYTGAILMLFLFVLMLVGVDTADSLVETIKGQRAWVVIGGLAALVLLLVAIGKAVVGDAVGLGQANAAGNVQGIAQLLFNRYVFAFEATAALLITAALGAMVLAHRERLTPKKGQADLADERMRRYADSGEHPGPLPTPGVFARHNAVDTPALLADGGIAETSVSTTLRERGVIHDPHTLAAPTARTVKAITGEGDADLIDTGPPRRATPEITQAESGDRQPRHAGDDSGDQTDSGDQADSGNEAGSDDQGGHP